MISRVSTTTVLAVLLVTGAGLTANQPDRMRVTSATNVRLRAAASSESAVAGTLKLGADLVELDLSKDGQWVRVRTTAGQEGWVSAPLTRAVPSGGRDRVLEEIARVRSGGHHGFDAAVELAALVSDLETRAKDSAQRASLALYRLMALKDAASYNINYSAPNSAWFKERSAMYGYNEPGGSWILRHDWLIAEHDRHRGTPSAPRIAALIVENGLGGECEGDVPCYVQRWNLVEGWYLREYPAGYMLGSVLQRLLSISTSWRAYQKDPRVFQAARDCVRLAKPLAEMRTVVAAARAPADERELHADVLRSLDLVAEYCKK